MCCTYLSTALLLSHRQVIPWSYGWQRVTILLSPSAGLQFNISIKMMLRIVVLISEYLVTGLLPVFSWFHTPRPEPTEEVFPPNWSLLPPTPLPGEEGELARDPPQTSRYSNEDLVDEGVGEAVGC